MLSAEVDFYLPTLHPKQEFILQNARFFITKNCVRTIKDARSAYVDATGELVKTQAEGLHHFDTLRYMIHAFYPDFITNPNKYRDAA